jgi:hypothetical protein
VTLQQLADRVEEFLGALATEATEDDFAPWVVEYLDAKRVEMYRDLSSGRLGRQPDNRTVYERTS